MPTRPGSLYKVGGRRYVDSLAIYNLAAVHEVVPFPDGWRVMVASGAVRCVAVEGRPALPGQRGALYELRADGGVSLKAQRATWVEQGLVRAGGTFASWPGEPLVKQGCGCGKTCGCAPCRLRYGTPHEATDIRPDSEPV